MPDLAEVAKAARAWACYDCGKCTATCPIARASGDYSPRRHVAAANAKAEREIVANGALFRCLTCGLCDQRCPAGVSYTQLVLGLREIAHREGVEPECPHGGALQSVMRMMAQGGTQQDRLGWLDEGLETAPEAGEVFYWTGCVMYYDAFFADFGVTTLEGAKSAVRLLNRLGVRPVVSPNERCCGHDLLWNGDRENFERLARHNLGLVAASGARTLVTSCAECLRTWRLDYAPLAGGAPLRMLHLTEFVAERLGELAFKPDGPRRVTFQDPCRLGRHLGIYDPPRRVLQALPGIELVEMRRTGPLAQCCAGGTWSDCGRIAKRMQVERLREARATGAELLVTACPKCQIHFRCAMQEARPGGQEVRPREQEARPREESAIEMRDIAEVVAAALA